MLLFKEGSVVFFVLFFCLSPAKKTNANNNSQNSKATVKDSYCTFLARTSVNSHWPFECPGTNPGVQDFCDMRKQCYSLPLLMIDSLDYAYTDKDYVFQKKRYYNVTLQSPINTRPTGPKLCLGPASNP